MKIVAFIGSPRKGGNTDLVVDQILRGAESRNRRTQKRYLYDLNILPCRDCRACKQGDCTCVLKDDLSEIYPPLEEADLIIFGTPLYWYGPTAQMKLLIDRLRPYLANRKLQGKKAVVVCPSEEGPDACTSLREMFEKSFEYLGMHFLAGLFPAAYEKAQIKESPQDMENAYDLGTSL
jgi:multimeric flavodoxin WrbA